MTVTWSGKRRAKVHDAFITERVAEVEAEIEEICKEMDRMIEADLAKKN